MVSLIGAGPGAPDLITVRGLRRLEAAEVVVWDRILGADFLQRLEVDTAGKRLHWLGDAEYGEDRQDRINRLLVAAARAGQRVARLKNGDPLVFGRGAEEAEYLDAHDVAWEFVPGLSASISICTHAGFPITNRGVGRSFAVVSARLAGGEFNQRLPRADSIVVLMGFKVMAAVCRRLVEEGWAPDTPACVIERGTMADERLVRGQLADVVERVATAGLASPMALVVGVAASRCYRPGAIESAAGD